MRACKTFCDFQEQQPDVLSEDEEAVLEGEDEDDDLIDTEDVQEPEVNSSLIILCIMPVFCKCMCSIKTVLCLRRLHFFSANSSAPGNLMLGRMSGFYRKASSLKIDF